MRIFLLGTAAAEGIPSPFCECPTCVHARQAGGRNVRMRTATLINDDLLLDCGPDIVAATQRFGVSLSGLETLLITHDHEDHLLPDNLTWRGPVYCPTPLASLRVYGPGPAMQRLRRAPDWPKLAEGDALTLETVRAGHRWRSGRYQITAVPATHQEEQAALLYVVSDGARKLFYATDSGPLSPRAWRILAREAPFDAVLMEKTLGATSEWTGHHSTESFLATHARFVREGWLSEGAAFVAFHFSHQSNPPHAELESFFAPYGVRVGYDGMELEI